MTDIDQDSFKLGVGAAIRLAEHCAQLAARTETPRNARVIAEHTARLVAAMRYANATDLEDGK